MALTRAVSDFKDSVKAATTTNINLSGGAPNTVDGISLSVNDSVLVKAQTDQTQNGIYRVSTLGTGSNGSWTRRSDFNDYRFITSGALTFVEQGALAGNTFYYLAGGEPNVQLGSTTITFSPLSTAIGASSNSNLQIVTNYGNTTTSNITISNTAQSSSTTSGAFVVTGGAAIGSNLYVGGNLVVFGNTNFVGTEFVTLEYVANIVANGGAASTSTTSGALQVQGGAGITGNLNIGGNITVSRGNVTVNTTGTAPPGNSVVGDTWYNTSTDTMYEYILDGNSNAYWVDVTSQPNSFGNLVVTNTATIANVSYTNLIQGGQVKKAISYTTSATAPANPSTGDQWYDTGTDSLYTYFTDGTSTFWLDISDKPNFIKFTTSASAPAAPSVGDQWYDSSTDILYTRISDGTSSYWLDIMNFPEALLYNAASTPPSTARSGDQWYDTGADVLYTRVSDGVSSYWVDLYTRFPSSNLSNGGTSVGLAYNGAITNYVNSANIFTITQSGTVTTGSSTVAGNQTINGVSTVNGFQQVTAGQNITGPVNIYGNIAVTGTTTTNNITETVTLITNLPPTATTNVDLLNSTVIYYTQNATTNCTVNVRGTSAASLTSILSVGQSMGFAIMVTNGGSAYYVTALTIDSNAQTIKWASGTAPSSGNTNSVDVYNFNIIKTGPATYTVLGTQTKFA